MLSTLQCTTENFASEEKAKEIEVRCKLINAEEIGKKGRQQA